jgi:hypothetical protein
MAELGLEPKSPNILLWNLEVIPFDGFSFFFGIFAFLTIFLL